MPIDLLSTARDLIAIDSRSSLSDRAVVDYLIPLFREVGLSISLQDEVRDSVTQWNLVGLRDADAPGTRRGTSAAGEVRPALLLATHLDTVPPGDAATWTRSGGRPFRLTEHAGMLYGLGAADVKLDILCKLLALERLRDTPLSRSVGLAGTYGEEVGRWGAKLLVRRLTPLPDAVLVGEPTGLRPCTAHKGYLEVRCRATCQNTPVPPDGCWWRVRFEGVPAHSSQPHRGRSANDACLDAVAALWRAERPPMTELRGGELVNKVAARAEVLVCRPEAPTVPGASVERWEQAAPKRWSPQLLDLLLELHGATTTLRDMLDGLPCPGFEPPHSTVNNGLVALSDGLLSHIVDVRRAPHDASEDALRRHLEALDQTAGSHPECRTTVEAALDEPPFETPPDSRLAPALREVLLRDGRTMTPERKSGTTEATAYRLAGLDAVVFGPGEAAGNIHRPDEHVPLTHLHAAVDVYEAVVRRLCGG